VDDERRTIERDTFRVFDCRDQTPTFLYTYEQAIKDGYLVDFDVYQAQTGFQRAGIRGASLSEEDRNALIEQGIDPDALDYAGTDLEVLVTNKDTIAANGKRSLTFASRIRAVPRRARRSSLR
jgi:type I site-specific restriction endonuclease